MIEITSAIIMASTASTHNSNSSLFDRLPFELKAYSLLGYDIIDTVSRCLPSESYNKIKDDLTTLRESLCQPQASQEWERAANTASHLIEDELNSPSNASIRSRFSDVLGPAHFLAWAGTSTCVPQDALPDQ